MANLRRRATTVYLDPRLAKAVKVKAALSDSSISDIVNDALAARLRQDAEDLKTMRRREKQPARNYDEFIEELRKDGLI